MPKKGEINIEAHKKIIKQPTDELNKTARGQLNASQNYDKNNVDNVRLRVPKGWKEQMQKYVKNSDRYNSVNSMICSLIKKEIGISENANDKTLD